MWDVMLSEERDSKRSPGWPPWTASAILHTTLIAALIFAHASSETPSSPEQKEILTPLVYLTPTPKPISLPPRSVRIPLPVPHPATLRAPVTKQFTPVVHETPKPVVIQTPEPILQPTAAPQVQIAKLKTPDLPYRPAPPPAPPAPVKTGVFGNPGDSPNGHTPSPRLEVQTGGFGGPEGTRGQSGTPSGSGTGVHTGGFGDSTASGTGGSRSANGRGAVIADSGFGTAAAQNPTAKRAESAPAETPVEVLWKPKPVYTNEARAKKLEGNVTLEVVFRATGDIHVLRVVRGLGSGLDESARAAAEQIRFRPSKKDGVPVDRTGLVLITFELT